MLADFRRERANFSPGKVTGSQASQGCFCYHSSMKPCYEIVMYLVKPRKEREFEEVYAQIQREMSALPGFVSSQKLQSLEDPRLFTDIWKWESEEHARSAHALYATLPHAKEFQHLIEYVLHSGHFSG